MADRPAKLQKLAALRHSIPITSKSSLEQTLAYLKEEGLPELTSSKAMRQANQAFLEKANTYGPLFQSTTLPTLSGGEQVVQFVNFWSWVHSAYKGGGKFYHLLKQCIDSSIQPLHLLVYSDEVTPGNVLAHVPTRKLWCVFVGIREMQQNLQQEDSWLTLCCLRSSLVSKLEGHLSALLKSILLSIFRDHVPEFGVQLQEPPDHAQPLIARRLKLAMGGFLMDGGALKFALSVKGDAGSRFCPLCKNIFLSKNSNAEEGIIDDVSAVTRKAQIQLASDAEIFASWQRMKNRKMECGPEDFRRWEQASGIAFSTESLLLCEELRSFLMPSKMIIHDWMHGLLSSGPISIAVYKFLESSQAWDNLHAYFKLWHIPSAFKGVQVANLFSPQRVAKHKRSDKFNSTASELLTLLPLLCHWLRNVAIPANFEPEQVQLLLALANLVDQLQATWHGVVQPRDILCSVESILARWKAIGWKMIRKHHWMLHYSDALTHQGCIPNCFAMERKNKSISQVATLTQNTRQFEKSIMEEVVTKELTKAASTDLPPNTIALLNPKDLAKKMHAIALAIWPHLTAEDFSHVRTAFSAKIQSLGTIARGDVVLIASTTQIFDCGELLALLSYQDQSFCVINTFALAELHPCHAVWQDRQNQEAVPLSHILTAVAWAKGDQSITTITPYRWR